MMTPNWDVRLDKAARLRIVQNIPSEGRWSDCSPEYRANRMEVLFEVCESLGLRVEAHAERYEMTVYGDLWRYPELGHSLGEWKREIVLALRIEAECYGATE